jgi:hypothetical protein
MLHLCTLPPFVHAHLCLGRPQLCVQVHRAPVSTGRQPVKPHTTLSVERRHQDASHMQALCL